MGAAAPVRRAAAVAVAALAACATGPEPIVVGVDSCAYCRMTIVEPQFAAELVSPTGRVYKFDSIECLAGYYTRASDGGDPGDIYVADFLAPDRLLPLSEAAFRHTAEVHTPMAAGIIAFANDEAAIAPAGEDLTWREVVERVRASHIEAPASLPLTP